MSAATRCRKCRRRLAVDFPTDGDGRVIEQVEQCAFCARKAAGICQRCKVRPVKARKGAGLHCAPCYRPAINERVKRRRAEKRPLLHAGICADCRAPVDGTVGRAVTCAECRMERKRASSRRGYQTDEAKRAARNEYKRQWRQKNRDKIRLQKRRSALRGKSAERMRRYRERAERGDVQPGQKAPRGPNGERLCLRCPTPLTGRPKLCRACKSPEMRAAA